MMYGHRNPKASNVCANVKIMIGTMIIPIPCDLLIPIRGGINPIIVPMIRTPIPIHPVDTQTNVVTKMITPNTIDCSGTAS